MASGEFAAVDEQRFQRFHWRTVVTTGLGVFCDGYDLSSLGLVLPLILSSFGIHKVSGIDGALLAASALAGAAVGALGFGALGQWGRKRFYGLDVLILGIAAVAQAFVPSIGWLIAVRFVLGLGTGADYVLSPMIMAEHANRANRGRALGLGFGTMWPLGALVVALFKLTLDALGVAPDLQWRIVLAGGAIPAFTVLYLRRQMPETARYLAKLGGDPEEAVRVMRQISGTDVAAPAFDARPFREVFARHARMIFSVALLWMVYDLVVYAGILFGPSLIAKGLSLSSVNFTLLIEIIFVLPASILMSLIMIDRVGRKPLQAWGFAASAVLLVLFTVLRAKLAALPLLAFAVYGLFNVTQTGPGLVSGAGILGVELAPTRIRSVSQGITVAGGRIGAAISGFAFPLLFAGIGERGAFLILAGLALLGAILTHLLIPETSQVSLEDLTDDRPALQTG